MQSSKFNLITDTSATWMPSPPTYRLRYGFASSGGASRIKILQQITASQAGAVLFPLYRRRPKSQLYLRNAMVISFPDCSATPIKIAAPYCCLDHSFLTCLCFSACRCPGVHNPNTTAFEELYNRLALPDAVCGLVLEYRSMPWLERRVHDFPIMKASPPAVRAGSAEGRLLEPLLWNRSWKRNAACRTK